MEPSVFVKEVTYHLDETAKLLQSHVDWLRSRPEIVPIERVLHQLETIRRALDELDQLNAAQLHSVTQMTEQTVTETRNTLLGQLEQQRKILLDVSHGVGGSFEYLLHQRDQLSKR